MQPVRPRRGARVAWIGEIDAPTDKRFAPALDSVPPRSPKIASFFAALPPRPARAEADDSPPITSCSPVTEDLLERVLAGLHWL